MLITLTDNKRPKHEQVGREYARAGTSYQQPQTYMFQSSTVTYGGSSGACYMSSTTRRSGGDGVSSSLQCCYLLRFKVLVMIVSSMSCSLQWKNVRKRTQLLVKLLTGSHVALAIRYLLFANQAYDFSSWDYT
jgi:hypothetical protein